MNTPPVLYSFRRCPYAMRARLALKSAHICCEIREIVLRDKAFEFLQASPKGTVPVLVNKGQVIEESLDIMLWALRQNDPEKWLDMPATGQDWIARADGPFKRDLDRTKYASRYPPEQSAAARNSASIFLRDLNSALAGQAWLFGDTPRLADFALLPFVRQFAHIDRAWFDAQPWPNVRSWLDAFLASERFMSVMMKYEKWQKGDTALYI